MQRIGKLKILSNNGEVEVALKEISALEGVTEVNVDNDILSYAIDEWASDYDIMVAIMNLLESKNVDSEPYFDDDISLVNSVSENNNVDNNGDHNHDGDDEDDHNHDGDDEDDDHEHCHGDDDGCCCSHHHKDSDKGFFKQNKGKFIELSISVLIFIIGLVFGAIPSVAVASPYVLIIAYTFAGYEILFEAVAKIFKKKFFTEQILMAIASICAILLGEVAEAAGIMILFSIGELFESGAIDNSRKIIQNLKKMQPDYVNVLDSDGSEKRVKLKAVEVGNVIIVKAGERIAIDGEVVNGNANVDTKTLTGESAYREIGVGSEVLAGFINVDGVLKIKTTKTYKQSAVCKIVDIVESASAKKSKSEKFISSFAKYYTPIIMILAVLVAIVPPFFYETYLVGFNIWLYRAVMMLCVACPCSLVISVPLTYFCGVGAGASNGVLIKASAYLEKLAKCKVVAFDKTGTLTTGEFKVTKILSTQKFQGKVLYFASVCEKNSNHPLAKSVLKQYGKEVTDEVSDFIEIAGRGISAKLNNQTILCGNAKLLQENGVKFKECEELGVKLYVAVDGEYAGAIVLNDTVRNNAYGAILELYDAGITNTVMLTGDNKEYARKIRKELNMRQSVSELLPSGKVEELERIINQTSKGSVAFVGDGINDAPVLARADVGFAMGGLGSDVAIDSADVVITDDDLSKVPYTIKLAKRTSVISKQNIIISLIVKFAVMILGVTGLVSSLWLAIGADVGMLILAILNAIRNRGKVY